jgi:hypothetical protein
LALVLILLFERQWMFAGLLGLLGTLLMVLSPGDIHYPGKRNHCTRNLQQLVTALLFYETNNRQLPRAANPGQYPFSWRVAILPYVGEQALYAQYRFDEPWDGPTNRRLAARMPSIFRCPFDRNAALSETSYLAVTGPGTLFPPDRAGRLRDATSGLNNSFVLAEVTPRRVPWMEPADISLDDLVKLLSAAQAASSEFSHRELTYAAMADGTVREFNVRAGPWRQLEDLQQAWKTTDERLRRNRN